MKEIRFDNKEVEEKYKLTIRYVRFTCPKCYRTWGVTIRNGMIEENSLICENCNKESHKD